ncbi:MAG: carbohydrate ABC transporter permease [Nitrososphaeria archaeon]
MSFIPYVQFKPNFRGLISGMINARTLLSLKDSLIVCIPSATIATLIGSLAGYSLARHKFKRIDNVTIVTGFILFRLIPPVVLSIPFFILVILTKLYDTPEALILAYSTLFMPYVVIITRDAFKSLPSGIEESAMIDGASTIRMMVDITLPLVTPALFAAFLLTFTFSWNEFLLAFVLTEQKVITISIRLYEGFNPAQVLMSVLPPIIICLLLQKYLVSGLTMGSVKG